MKRIRASSWRVLSALRRQSHLNEAEEGRHAGPAGHDDDSGGSVDLHGVERVDLGVEPIDIDEEGGAGVGGKRGPLRLEPQSLRPRPQVLDVDGEDVLLLRSGKRTGRRGQAPLLGQGRRGTAESDGDSVRFVRAQRARRADVDERAAPGRLLLLGVSENQAGVVLVGVYADEAGGASLGLGLEPPVPVAPSTGGGVRALRQETSYVF